jgi:membrane-associated phospholipid phosphatase
MAARLRDLRSHALVREVSLVAFATLAYFGVRNLTVGSAAEAFSNAERLTELEEGLGLDWERALQDALLDHGWAVTLFNWIYIWGHWPVIIATGILLYRRSRDRYLLLRNAMMISGVVGFLFFALLPLAPPRLVDRALVDTVTDQSSSYRALQPPGLTNQYAAFPSLHFGWNVLVGIAVWGATRRVSLRALSLAGPAAMGLAVVVTANHYVVDLIGGLVIVVAAFWVARDLQGHTGRYPLPRGVRGRPPRGQRSCAPEGGRAAARGPRRGGRPIVARPRRGAPSEDARPGSHPVGPLAARESPRGAARAARAAGGERPAD